MKRQVVFLFWTFLILLSVLSGKASASIFADADPDSTLSTPPENLTPTKATLSTPEELTPTDATSSTPEDTISTEATPTTPEESTPTDATPTSSEDTTPTETTPTAPEESTSTDATPTSPVDTTPTETTPTAPEESTSTDATPTTELSTPTEAASTTTEETTSTETTSTTEQPTATTPGPPECSLTSDEAEYFPHESDCTKYYECFAGNRYLYTCSNNLWWHQSITQCDYPGPYCKDFPQTTTKSSTDATKSDTTQTDTTGTGTTNGNDPRCSGSGTTYWLEPGNCSIYIQCTDGKSYSVSCPKNTYFSEDRKQCVSKDAADCCQKYDCN